MVIPSKYKNKNSIVLESTRIQAEFIPDPGGKLASLINKETDYEYVVQRKNELYRDQPFDGVFVKGECSGFDDMFPTIDVCNYENEPWKGVKMADHGEVWSLPCEYKNLFVFHHIEPLGINLACLLTCLKFNLH